ncbi:paraquat-inducible protein A [Alteromonas confluentis]|uniref:paraquat-inducible protein A n=1 Tax=Alteromonas confluentis TaxID=1656094 RepID=UPI0009F38810|nr:paraquat-inducible protein A [Alteromonas confluentis]
MHTESSQTIQCEQCLTVVALPALAHRQRAVCPNCGHTLLTYRRHQNDNVFALAFSALVFLALSLPFNFLSFRSSGIQHQIALPDSFITLFNEDYMSLAIITGAATVIFPGLVLLGMLVLSHCRHRDIHRPFVKHIFFWVKALLPWSMAEIFLVGTLVSLIKISSMADISIGLSFYAFIGFAICMTACIIQFDSNRFALWLFGEVPSPKPLTPAGASVSIQRTWALLITATLLYIPANLLPIMHTEMFGRDEPSTIIGGAITLWESGDYPVALIIIIASVFIPVAKIVVLAWLNLTVQRGLEKRARIRTRFYQIIEGVGRWSMIDVFVVAILVALVQLGNTFSIYPGPAALAFCAVVFVTMVAAMTFDTRLIWQNRK